MFDIGLGSRRRGRPMITAAQLRAARLLLGIDQRRLAELSGLSVPTIQRMEASETMVRGNVDSLVKLIAALDAAGIEMIDEGAVSNSQGRGVRLKMNSASAKADSGQSGGTQSIERNEGRALDVSRRFANVMCRGIAGDRRACDRSEPRKKRHGRRLRRDAGRIAWSHCSARCAACSAAPLNASNLTLPIGLPWLGAHFRLDALASFFLVVVNLGGRQQAFMVLATASTTPRRTACCPSSPPFWPA